jgi:hypothetical protein
MRLLGQVAVGRRSPDPERLGELPYGFTGGKLPAQLLLPFLA